MNLYSAGKGGDGGGVWEGGEEGVCGGVVTAVAEIPTSVLVGVEVSGRTYSLNFGGQNLKFSFRADDKFRFHSLLWGLKFCMQFKRLYQIVAGAVVADDEAKAHPHVSGNFSCCCHG